MKLIKTKKSHALIRFLKEEYLVNLNILGILENVEDIRIYVDDEDNPSGVYIERGFFNYLYTREESFIEAVAEFIPEDSFRHFAGVEMSIMDMLKKKLTLVWENRCNIYYIDEESFNEEIGRNITEDVKFEDAEVVDSFYTYRSDKSIIHIKDDIKRRPSSAVYQGNEIVCWVLTHDDNSLGIMYTKEEHRRKGYAVDTAVDIIRKTLDKGRVPFIHIVDDNEKSMGLAKKCGFKKFGEVSFCGLMKGCPDEHREYVSDRIREFKGKAGSLADGYTTVMNMFYPALELQEAGDMELHRCTGDDLNLWCEVFERNNNLTEEKAARLRAYVLGEDAPEDNWFFIGRKDDSAVSTGAIFLDKNDHENGFIWGLSSFAELERENIVNILKEAMKEEQYFWIAVCEENKNRILEEAGFTKIIL